MNTQAMKCRDHMFMLHRFIHVHLITVLKLDLETTESFTKTGHDIISRDGAGNFFKRAIMIASLTFGTSDLFPDKDNI